MHGLLEDLELVVELGDEGALAERARDEAPLQLVRDVLPGTQLLVVLSWLGQQLQKWDGLALQGDGAQGIGTSLQASMSLQPAGFVGKRFLTPSVRFPPVFQRKSYI